MLILNLLTLTATLTGTSAIYLLLVKMDFTTEFMKIGGHVAAMFVFVFLFFPPRSQGLLCFQDGHLQSGVDPGNEFAILRSR